MAITLAASGATSGQVITFDGTDWVPADTNTTPSGGTPITIAPSGATNGQVIGFDGTDWVPVAPAASGPAGGALSGTYPDPLIANLTTVGAIPFVAAEGILSEATELFWDEANARLGIGNESPQETLSLGSSGSEPSISLASLESPRWRIRATSHVFTGVRDNIFDIGWNVGQGYDTTEHSYYLQFESKYKAAADADAVAEFFLTYDSPVVPGPSFQRRPIFVMTTLEGTNQGASVIDIAGLFSLKSSDRTKTGFVFEDGGNLRVFAASIDAQGTGTKWLRQKDTGGTQRALLYLDVSNQVVVGESNVVRTGSHLFVNGDINATTGGSQATSLRLRVNDPVFGGNASVNVPSGYALILSINDSAKVRINPGGNVIVGDGSEAGYKLDVNGTFRASGASTLNGLSVSGGATINGTTVFNSGFTAVGNGIHSAPSGATAISVRNASNNQIWQVYPVTNGAGTDLRWYENGDRVTFQAGGKLGIGTTNPATSVHISETRALTSALSDGFAASVTTQPVYTSTSALAVSRHNYISLKNVAAQGSAPPTIGSGAVFYFDAAQGSHVALDGPTTKANPGAVDAWMKVNVNGQILFVPVFASKTA